MSYLTKAFDAKVVELLKQGAVGFMPSDTIYGLSCLALDQSAVERLRKLKKRDDSKRMIVLIASVEQLDLLKVDKLQIKPAEKYWPGPLTLICDAPNSATWLNRGQGEFGVRIPAKEQLRDLIQTVGPIISTSANYQGEDPINSAKQAQEMFGDQLNFYVDGGDLSSRLPSTIAEIENGKLQVLRPGAVKI